MTARKRQPPSQPCEPDWKMERYSFDPDAQDFIPSPVKPNRWPDVSKTPAQLESKPPVENVEKPTVKKSWVKKIFGK